MVLKNIMSEQVTKVFKNAKLIVNPNSGKGKNKFPLIESLLGIRSDQQRSFSVDEVVKYVSDYLENHDIRSQVCFTERAGHATELATSSLDETIDLVVAVGGDGTINEVLNGLARSDMPMAVIPLGTANVFSLEFGIPSDIEKACRIIVEGNVQSIDLGRLGKKYFVCMAGVGFDAFVIKKADRYLKRVLGAFSYMLVAMKEFLTYRFYPIFLTIDDQPIPRKGYFVIVGNTKYYGGQFFATPHADPSDGYLDVCIFRYKNVLSALIYIFNMKFGRITENLSVEYFKAKKIKIEESGHHSVHVDAEYLCETPVEILVEPNSLWIVK
jgi:diacylglycerol kinase (ATP)